MGNPSVEVVGRVLGLPAERARAGTLASRVCSENKQETNGLELLVLELGRLGRGGLALGVERLGVDLCELLVLVLAVLDDVVAVEGTRGCEAVGGLGQEEGEEVGNCTQELLQEGDEMYKRSVPSEMWAWFQTFRPSPTTPPWPRPREVLMERGSWMEEVCARWASKMGPLGIPQTVGG